MGIETGVSLTIAKPETSHDKLNLLKVRNRRPAYTLGLIAKVHRNVKADEKGSGFL